MKTPITAFTLALLLSTAPAGAQTDAEAGWDTWDADASGAISQEEFRSKAEETGLFGIWDENDDDQISSEEYGNGLFSVLDDDDDGALTVSEWDEGIDRIFGEQAANLETSAWDDDGDGTITREEFNGQIGEAGLFASMEPGDDEQLGQDEFLGGLFETADADDDQEVSNDEFLFDDFLF